MNLFLIRLDASQLRRSGSNTPSLPAWCRNFTQRWYQNCGASVLLAGDGHGVEHSFAEHNGWYAVGSARLDNRTELLRRYAPQARTLPDLVLVLHAIAADHGMAVSHLLGDFAFVAWNPAVRHVIGARDAFGVHKLYRTVDGGHLCFASRADLLSPSEAYNASYLTRLIATAELDPDETAYEGVNAVSAAHYVESRDGRLAVHQYWTPTAFEPGSSSVTDLRDAAHQFRQLHSDAVRNRLPDTPAAWATLSGGLDSSSVVSMAESMRNAAIVPHGVAGTVSWVYRWSPEGDEREYSDAVADHYGVRNHVVQDCWFWQDDGSLPPITEQPDPAYALYARDRLTAQIVRDAGGSILLTGFGADHYLLGNMFFFADWLVKGQIRRALTEMVHRAATGRVSFWNLAFQNALLPLLPPALQKQAVRTMHQPAWLSPAAARRWVTPSRVGATPEYAGRPGHKYGDLVLSGMRSIPRLLSMYGVLDLSLELRHPFLYRPLVEFALRLPPEACVQPYARKWILREAMNGVLPEKVRGRVGKGANGPCIGQSLIAERQRIDRIIAHSVLADLGCMEPRQLRAALASATQSGTAEECATIAWTLSVDTWLQVRSGRWTEGNGHHVSAEKQLAGSK